MYGPRLTRIGVSLSAVLCVVATQRGSTQTLTADQPWAGSARCQLDIQGPGYVDQQIHTWTLTGGTPTIQGAYRVYPGTWSVTGGGSSQRTVGTQTASSRWTTSVPGVSAPIAVLARASDGGVVIQPYHGQLRARGAVTGMQQVVVDGRSQPPSQIVADAFEWAFPVANGAPTSTILSGSSSPVVDGSIGYLQPAGSRGTASCTWQFTVAATASSAAATAATATSPTISLGPAGSGGTIQTLASPAGSPAPAPIQPDPWEPGNNGPTGAPVLQSSSPGSGATFVATATFHSTADNHDWFSARVQDAETTATLQLAVSLSGGPPDGVYEIGIYESPGSPARMVGGPSHAPIALHSWPNTTGSDTKTLLIDVHHISGALGPYTLTLGWPAEAFSTGTISTVSGTPRTTLSASPSTSLGTGSAPSTTGSSSSTTTSSSTTGSSTTAVQPDPSEPGNNVPSSATTLASSFPGSGQTYIASATFHAASDTHDWFQIGVADTNATATLQLAVALSGGPPDGMYEIAIYDVLSQAARITAGPLHAPNTLYSWPNTAANDSKNLWIDVHHVSGTPGEYTLNFTWPATASVIETIAAPPR